MNTKDGMGNSDRDITLSSRNKIEKDEQDVNFSRGSQRSGTGYSFRMRFFSRSSSRSNNSFTKIFDESSIDAIPEISFDKERFLVMGSTESSFGGYLWRKGYDSKWKKNPDYYQIRNAVLLQFRHKRKFGFRKGVVYSLYRMIELKYCTATRVPGDKPALCLTHRQDGGVSEVDLAAFDDHRLELWLSALTSSTIRLDLSLFDPIAKIGEGEWGSVYVAQKGENIFAVKEIEVNYTSNIQHLVQERRVLTSISRHPFVVTLDCAFRKDNFVYFVMGFAPGGDLFTKMQRSRPSKGEATLYAAEILLALEHLHQHHIVYRDLKPENILLGADGHILLADMGLARQLGMDEYAKTFCGTESYLAPEILQRRPYRLEVDFWQYGCLVFELYCGRSPFWKPRHLRQNLHEKIIRGVYKFPAAVPSTAKTMIHDLLNTNPSQRAGCRANGWKEVKEYEYFSKTSFSQILRNGSKPAKKITAQSIRHFIVNFDDCFTSTTPQWKSDIADKPHEEFFRDEMFGFDFKKLD